MATRSRQCAQFQLGSVRVDPDRNAITSDDQEFRLEPRVMDVLCMLAARPNAVVSRAELIEALWPSEFGADESLTRAVSLIRKALVDAGTDQPAIETIKKRGYRLLLPVAQASDGKSRIESSRAKARRLQVLIGMALLVALITTLWIVRAPNPAVEALASVEPTSVIVLPFESLSDERNDAYWGVGVAEELLNALSGLRDLRVVGRTSAFASDNAGLDPKALGERLGASHIVTGSVRRENDQIRISAQLLRASDANRLWASQYEVSADELLAVEDEIVLEIAQALQVRLGVGAASNRSSGRGIDPSAYEQYLQGLRFWGDRMRVNGNREKAMAAFEQAVVFDPEFADAWAGIGTVAVYSVGSPLSRNREQFTRRTESALQRAIELDPDNPRALAALVVFNVTQKIDIEAAGRYLDRAYAVAPNSSTTHYAASSLHRMLGDAQGALAALDRAILLDPLDSVLETARGSVLLELGRADEAMAVYETCFETQCLNEGFVAYASAAAVFSGDPEYRARWEPRVNEFESFVESLPRNQLPIVAQVMPAFSSIRYDRADKADQIARIRELFEEQPITDTIGLWGPTLAPHLPDEHIFELLHLAYERGDLFSAAFSMSPMYGINPYPRWVLEHPRYHELWQRPGMPELAAEWRKRERVDGLPIATPPDRP